VKKAWNSSYGHHPQAVVLLLWGVAGKAGLKAMKLFRIEVLHNILHLPQGAALLIPPSAAAVHQQYLNL